MIQRIQTLWLSLAAACSIATLLLPFYAGNKENNTYFKLTGQSHFFLLILCVAVILSTALSVFYYKNRKKQMLVIAVTLALQIINIVFYLYQIKSFTTGELSFTALFTFAIPVFLVMALYAIRKDEKLIQDMDRLR